MWEIVAQAEAGYVVMHMQGNPETMQENPSYQDVVGEVEAFFIDRLARLAKAGVAPQNVALDVGIGFGKTPGHNRRLLGQLGRFAALGRPLMVGVSRKSFLGRLSGSDLGERLPAALACTCWAVQVGAQIIRTHDVSATLRAIRMTEALQVA
jgi:dihydropteroate synthase